jgi:hypothetical protein
VETNLTLLFAAMGVLAPRVGEKQDNDFAKAQHYNISALTPSGSATIPLGQISMKLHTFFKLKLCQLRVIEIIAFELFICVKRN